MSTAHDAHAQGAHGAHDHPFDPEPARMLPADEPRTPDWIPALGVALFVIAGIAFLLDLGPSEHPAPEPQAAAPTAPARPEPRPKPPEGAAPDAQAQPPPPIGTFKKLNPAQMELLRQKLKEHQPKDAPNAAPGAAPAPPPQP